jgi:hypothetical protein
MVIVVVESSNTELKAFSAKAHQVRKIGKRQVNC